MALSFGTRRFISPGLKAQFQRRMAELAGVAVAVAGLALLLALVSYHAQDPSFDTASNARALNLAGPAGAWISDLLLQSFGIAGFLPGLILLAWAYRLAQRGRLGYLKTRIFLGSIAMPLLAAALAMAVEVIPGPAVAWPVPAGIGGAAGYVLSDHFGHSAFGRTGAGVAMLFCLIRPG